MGKSIPQLHKIFKVIQLSIEKLGNSKWKVTFATILSRCILVVYNNAIRLSGYVYTAMMVAAGAGDGSGRAVHPWCTREKCLGKTQEMSRPPGALNHVPQGTGSDWPGEGNGEFKAMISGQSVFGNPWEKGKLHKETWSCVDQGKRGSWQLNHFESLRTR